MKRAFIMGLTATLFAASASGSEVNRLPDPVHTAFTLPSPGETSFDFKLNGYVFGFKMIDARYKGRIGPVNYTAYSDINTSGLGALLKKLRIWAVTKGQYDENGLYPLVHTQQNLDKKSRRVEMNYDYDARKVKVDINPRLGSQGTPPASTQQRFDSDDTLSAILAMMMRGTRIDGELCKGTIPVFDSKQHYSLRMERLGTKTVKYNGEKVEGIKCHIFYEAISGYDSEDLPSAEEASTPINVYFAKDTTANLYVPVKFTYRISGFKATIKLSDMRIAVAPKITIAEGAADSKTD